MQPLSSSTKHACLSQLHLGRRLRTTSVVVSTVTIRHRHRSFQTSSSVETSDLDPFVAAVSCSSSADYNDVRHLGLHRPCHNEDVDGRRYQTKARQNCLVVRWMSDQAFHH